MNSTTEAPSHPPVLPHAARNRSAFEEAVLPPIVALLLAAVVGDVLILIPSLIHI